MFKNKGLLKFVALMGLGISLLSMGSVTVNASSKPYWGHFDSKKITYHIDSTSKHYRGIFKAAVKNWETNGVIKLVNTKKKSKADIRITSVKNIKHDAPDRNNSSLFGGSIMNTQIRLSRHYIKKYNYSDTQIIQFATAELGSALGLNYVDSDNSIMGGSQTITSFDRANLKAAYKGVK
ncbi:zinc metalloprotease [Levilactobacillus enshiensis]|uniref:hypothetical protein n=1 Tax=Levilactobacillus enshiensis TaxID=2590213 RepID=UPI00117ABF3C|nr:hypothetical protein [Levilactobacillus enshiensis]